MRPIKIILKIFLILSPLAICAGESLYIFYPSIVRPRAVEKNLTEALPQVKVTVFGRYRDFEDQIKTGHPDAIISSPYVIEKFQQYETKLKGLSMGDSLQTYLLLSIGEEHHPENLSGKSIGVVDFLKRNDMKEWVHGYLPAKPKLKHVTKIEDLLPLLRFKMVDAVFIPRALAEYFKSNSKLNFATRKLSKHKMGIISLAVAQGNSPAVTQKIKALKLDQRAMFGVELWK